MAIDIEFHGKTSGTIRDRAGRNSRRTSSARRPSQESLQQSSAIQKEVLEDWQQAGRYWLDRMQSEMALWGELGSKLAATRSASQAFDAYAKCVAQQMKMTAEDGQRLLKDLQCVTQKVIQSVKKEVTQRIVR
jgi:hypothetical protein